MKTLTDFIATRQPCADLGERFSAEYFDKSPRAGFVYDGDCYIEQEDDGSFYLILYRDEYTAATLAELEPILYLFAVTECPQALGIPNDVHTLICNIESAIGTEKLAHAIVANMADPCDVVCHTQSYTDTNQIALDTVRELTGAQQYDIDSADALYNKARPVLRGSN